jgi:hypothetical protein
MTELKVTDETALSSGGGGLLAPTPSKQTVKRDATFKLTPPTHTNPITPQIAPPVATSYASGSQSARQTKTFGPMHAHTSIVVPPADATSRRDPIISRLTHQRIEWWCGWCTGGWTVVTGCSHGRATTTASESGTESTSSQLTQAMNTSEWECI